MADTPFAPTLTRHPGAGRDPERLNAVPVALDPGLRRNDEG